MAAHIGAQQSIHVDFLWAGPTVDIVNHKYFKTRFVDLIFSNPALNARVCIPDTDQSTAQKMPFTFRQIGADPSGEILTNSLEVSVDQIRDLSIIISCYQMIPSYMLEAKQLQSHRITYNDIGSRHRIYPKLPREIAVGQSYTLIIESRSGRYAPKAKLVKTWEPITTVSDLNDIAPNASTNILQPLRYNN